jgi:hypothetical protein
MPSRSGAGRASGNIIVCGRSYNIGWKVVNWYDNPAFSAYYQGCYKGKDGGRPTSPYPFSPAKGLERAVKRYRERRYMGGARTDLRRLQDIIRQFVIHHDGCATSDACFHVLHDERGLSVHFLIDNDGTIYQTLDLADGAFHAAGVNEISIGVEMCNRGIVELDGPDFYRRHGIDRGMTECIIHNTRYHMWTYTTQQYMAMEALGKALARLLPNLPQVFPEWNGALLNTWMQEPRSFAGYIGHFHITNNKWDPGCFDFRWLAAKIRSRAVWFTCLDRDNECRQAPEIDDDLGRAEAQSVPLLRNNEEDSMGGYFPVGPFGKTRLWHGGVHLSLGEGTPIFTPFPGRIVALKYADDVPIGSANFVLMRHYLRLAGKEIVFFMLYYHLQREDPHTPRMSWINGADKAPFWSAVQSGDVAYPDIDLGGGEVIGHAGHAGPPGNYEGQIHVEVMAAQDIGALLDPGYWKPIDGSSGGLFCDVPEIISLIDRPKGRGDGLLSESELRNFYQHDEARAELRKLAVRSRSEWGASPDYETSLLRSKDFRALPKAARARLFRDQIQPTLFYTEELAQKVGLPKDFVVWHYHPVRFVAWMNTQLKKQATTVAGAILINQGPAAASVGDDRDSVEGFTDEEDEMSLEAGKRLGLEELSNGYPEEKEAK